MKWIAVMVAALFVIVSLAGGGPAPVARGGCTGNAPAAMSSAAGYYLYIASASGVGPPAVIWCPVDGK